MQRYIAVNAAVEGEIRLLRVDRVIVAVVHRDGQYIVAGAQGVGNVHAEGGVAALVLGQLLSVQADHGGHGHAVKLQHGAPARRELRHGQNLGIVAGAAVVIVAAVLPVHGVPGVGQGDGLIVTVFRKNPILIQ